MTYRGHVRQGRIELDDDVQLPEGVEVELKLAVPPQRPPSRSAGHSPTTPERREAIRLLEDWCARRDDKDSQYWDDFERETAENRLSFHF